MAKAVRDLLVFLGFAAVSYAYFGWRLLPHPGRVFIGVGVDPQEAIWAFGWFPHALLHGTNPIVTHAVYAPEGFNLTWATSTPGLAYAFAPVTLLFGPVAAYNVAMLLLPALSAYTAYRLCLYLSGSVWGALVGGYVYGFSSYVLGHELRGHPILTAAFVLPLIALTVIRFIRGELTGPGLVVRLGLLLGLQFWISTEVSLTLTIALVLGLGLACLFVSGVRGRVRALPLPLAGAYALGGLVAAPLVVYSLSGFQSSDLSAARTSVTDLASLVVPTGLNELEGGLFPSLSAQFEVEDGLFIGLPALLILVLYAWRGRRSPSVQFLTAAFALSVFLTLGTAMRVDGHRAFRLPWALAQYVPALDNIHPDRLAVYVALAAAVSIALWTAGTKGRTFPRPFVLPVLAVAALVPAAWKVFLPTHPSRVTFFTTGLYRSCLPRGEIEAIFPFGIGGNSMLWQAESGFRFSIAEGYLVAPGSDASVVAAFNSDPVVRELVNGATPTMTSLLAFAARHRVGRFISVLGDGYPNASEMRSIGPVERVGGVLVAPACGQPPLTTRDLSGAEQQAKLNADRTLEYCGASGMVGVPATDYPSGSLATAPLAIFVEGQGLVCGAAPPGYVHRGYASVGVPGDTYRYYAR